MIAVFPVRRALLSFVPILVRRFLNLIPTSCFEFCTAKFPNDLFILNVGNIQLLAHRLVNQELIDHLASDIPFKLSIPPSHGAYFGSGDRERSPSVNPTFQIEDHLAHGDNLHNVRLGTCRCWEQHVRLEYTSRGRWHLGFGAGHIPAAQSNGCEF